MITQETDLLTPDEVLAMTKIARATLLQDDGAARLPPAGQVGTQQPMAQEGSPGLACTAAQGKDSDELTCRRGPLIAGRWKKIRWGAKMTTRRTCRRCPIAQRKARDHRNGVGQGTPAAPVPRPARYGNGPEGVS